MDLVPPDEKSRYRKGSVMVLATPEDPHKKGVSCYSYDSYNDNTFGLHLEDDVVELAEFKKGTNFVVSVPSAKLQLIGCKLAPKMKFKLSTHCCRKFISSVIKSVQKNMRFGRHFAEYSSSNMLATRSGRAKFKRVKMFPPGPNTRKRMYECTWRVILGQFHDDGNIPDNIEDDPNVPEDLKHLISLIRYKPQKEMLFAVHPSLVLEDDKPWCFVKMYEYVKFKASQPDKDMILSKLPYLKDWRTIVYKCAVLTEAYEHPKANYDPLGDMKDGKPTTPFQKLLHEAEKFIDFVRNGTAHRLQRVIHVTPSQHQRIIDVFFPRLAPEMQEAIYDVIGKDEFEAYFLKVDKD